MDLAKAGGNDGSPSSITTGKYIPYRTILKFSNDGSYGCLPALYVAQERFLPGKSIFVLNSGRVDKLADVDLVVNDTRTKQTCN